MFGYVNDNEPEKVISSCKKITMEIVVVCEISAEKKPYTRKEKLSWLLGGWREVEYEKYMRIFGDSLEEIESIEENMQERFPQCDIIRIIEVGS